MSNPPNDSRLPSPPRIPTVKQICWLATIPQLLVLTVACIAGWWLTKSPFGVASGAGIYLIYSYMSRRLIPRAHRRGVRLSQEGQFEDALLEHKKSYDFFTRHSWLDRYRSITMMSPSAMSFREMALINIAFAHAQLGNGEMARQYYRRTVEEFPTSGIGNAALQMIASFEQSSTEASDDAE